MRYPMTDMLGWLDHAVYAGGDRLEKTRLNLGFIPLTDCAALVVAQRKGYFKKYGLDVNLSLEASWANIRDKVATEMLDGAQMLAPMPIATSLGIGIASTPTITAFSLGLNGNAITVSNPLYQQMLEFMPPAGQLRPMRADGLKQVIEMNKQAGKEPLHFAMVFPFSSHNYQLRYWLSSAGIDPDEDMRISVIPPPQMVASLIAGEIDGYCVGEPWNEQAVCAGAGHAVITSHEIWHNCPEKVLGVNLDWAERFPNTHLALLKALLEAARWMDKPEHRLEVAKLIADPAYVNAPLDVVQMSMTGAYQYGHRDEPVAMPDFNVFYRYGATYPWRSHAIWFITQMYRWGQLSEPVDMKAVAAAVYRPDLYRQAAQALDFPYPTIEHKLEGLHDQAWILQSANEPMVMGADRFLDDAIFDPARPLAYLERFPRKRLTVDIESLRKLNG